MIVWSNDFELPRLAILDFIVIVSVQATEQSLHTNEMFKARKYTLPETNITWKMMVGIHVSFWDGLFSGAMLGSVSRP